MRHTTTILVTAAIAIAGCATIHDRDSSATVPAAVDRALREQAGAATLGPVEREGDRYEAAWRDADGRHEVEVAADGRVLEREDELAAAAVPAAVAAALKAAFADADRVTWVRHELPATGLVFFEANLTAGGRRHEVQFAADGAATTDPEDGESEDDDDDDDDEVDD